MKKFVEPEINVEMFHVEDVITASGDSFVDDNTGEPI